jgi:hypothetical protein
MATENKQLDEELRRILKIAADMTPVPQELLQQQIQSSWPWQVPQVETYTTDHTPPAPGRF